jgi:glycosyltransferase involved in cell wall biosynthesis
MGWGGINKYLIDVLRQVDTQKFKVDFLVHVMDDPYHPNVQELKSLGCRIILCPDPRKCVLKPWQYIKPFKKNLQEYGPYDIVHAHAAPFDGAVLHLARQCGVPVRIVTCHTHPPLNEYRQGLRWYHYLVRKFYYTLSQIWISQSATIGIGVSIITANYMFGRNWHQNPRRRLLYCGIDLKPFQQEIDSTAIRVELGIPKDAFIIGHAGRFDEPKNHAFFVEIAAEIIKREPNAYFLLIGDGHLRPEIEQKVSQLGITNHFVFAGSRSDVPRLMLGAMDAFLFPSLYEGLGLVLVEAQASGLPCVFTSSLPEEVDIVDSLMHRLELSQGTAKWAEALIKVKGTKSEKTRASAFSLVRNSHFNIEIGANNLLTLYEDQIKVIHSSY